MTQPPSARKRADVAVLYCDAAGVYSALVDPALCWDKARDARAYDLTLPVVAHPPCQLWVNFASLNFSRWGGEHNRPGNDGGCFAHALETVRRFGGVLEHPAGSHAWEVFGLPKPRGVGWQRTLDLQARGREWTCEVWQSAYGHRARKRTWLLYVGSCPLDGIWTREPGTHQVGWFDRIKPSLGKREASATPIAFAEWLLDLAARAGKSRAA